MSTRETELRPTRDDLVEQARSIRERDCLNKQARPCPLPYPRQWSGIPDLSRSAPTHP